MSTATTPVKAQLNGATPDLPDEPAAIAVRDLHKAYGPAEALRGVSFDVRRGEIFALLGPNGAGKTTMIEILEGYRRRTSGEALVLGADPGRPARRWRERIGLVLQECELDPNLTVRETCGSSRASTRLRALSRRRSSSPGSRTSATRGWGGSRGASAAASTWLWASPATPS